MTKIAIIGGEQSGRTTLASKLGRKGNVSDVTIYDFAKSGTILTITDATGYPKSVKPLLTAINLSDIVLLLVPPEGPDAFTGECIVLLDLLNYKHGMIILTKSDTSYPYALEELEKKIRTIGAGTVIEGWECAIVSAETFEGMEELKEMLSSVGAVVDNENAELGALPARVTVDHVFNVTGIGCVILGVVAQGTIHAKDKMLMMPAEKPVEIRSIQLHDVDAKSAATGARVGLALKHIQPKDVERGDIISEGEIVSTGFTLNTTISKFTKQIMVGDVLHLFVGLQSAPARIEEIRVSGECVDSALPGSECTLTLSGSKKLAYTESDRFILANLDEKQRFVGYGFIFR